MDKFNCHQLNRNKPYYDFPVFNYSIAYRIFDIPFIICKQYITLLLTDFREISAQRPLNTENTTSKKKKKNKKNKNKGINSDNGVVKTVNVSSDNAASLNVKNKKNKQKLNSSISTPAGLNTKAISKEKHPVSTPKKDNILPPTVGNTVKNPNKKKNDKKKNKSSDNAYKQLNKNEGKVTETVELAASKKLKNKMKERKHIGQLNREKGKHQANKQGIGSKIKKKFRQK